MTKFNFFESQTRLDSTTVNSQTLFKICLGSRQTIAQHGVKFRSCTELVRCLLFAVEKTDNMPTMHLPISCSACSVLSYDRKRWKNLLVGFESRFNLFEPNVLFIELTVAKLLWQTLIQTFEIISSKYESCLHKRLSWIDSDTLSEQARIALKPNWVKS